VDEAMLAVVADQAAAATAEQVGQMRTPGIPGWGFPRSTRKGIDSTPDCPLENGTFVCTHDRHGGTAEVRITFMDASGQTQSDYDEDVTAQVHVVSEMERNLQRESSIGYSMRSSDLTVSGLAGDEQTRMWTGQASGESSRSGERGSADVQFSSDAQSVVIPHPRADDSWPTSGTMRSVVSGEFTDADGVQSTVQTDLFVEFNGTQFPDATLNGEAMELDLAARRGHMKGRRHGQG